MQVTLWGFFCSASGKYFLLNVAENGTPLVVIETVGNIYNALSSAGMPTIPSQC